jgi:predicted O-linked N-acetylglucosamine transferase (SPINDLY family)
MAMYHGIDLALDPWPHNGMRTTFMALWMGVPVLTKAGDAMVSRMGVSLVSEAGLPDWVAPDPDADVDLACSKCNNLGALADLRRNLRGMVTRSRLLDGERFARSLEAAFVQMIEEKSDDDYVGVDSVPDTRSEQRCI